MVEVTDAERTLVRALVGFNVGESASRTTFHAGALTLANDVVVGLVARDLVSIVPTDSPTSVKLILDKALVRACVGRDEPMTNAFKAEFWG